LISAEIAPLHWRWWWNSESPLSEIRDCELPLRTVDATLDRDGYGGLLRQIVYLGFPIKLLRRCGHGGPVLLGMNCETG
jgi:hypothetical protein